MRLKVHDSIETMCVTCRNGQVTQFENGKRLIMCSAVSPHMRVERVVVRCTDYEDRRTIDEWDMRKIAWQVRTDNSGKILGFTPPNKKDE